MNGSVFLYVALLHHDFMLSSLMVSRQISYSASVRIYLTPPRSATLEEAMKRSQ